MARQALGRPAPGPTKAARVGVILILGGVTLGVAGVVAGSGNTAAAGFAFAAVQAAVLLIRRSRRRSAPAPPA